MSKQNPLYPPVIQYINNLPKDKIFTIDDISKELNNFDKKYLTALIRNLSTKEFYIGKNYNEVKKKKIDNYYKIKDIPTDKNITDIYWFLKYDL